ncbi:MAG TPA: efflux RND transporter periplasmic adaptor subunit, partial [Planctomycetota bacterium]|nr:efflux RND transporter periplasmic adaptor subunit [Planctomycetota bacterium]
LPFEAELARARATRAEAEADLARAHQDVARYAPLVEKNAISREEYETAVAVEKAAGAALEAADALVQSAEIELSYTQVFAPIEGMVGKTEVYPGTLVSKVSNTLMTELSALDPIRARISLSEREYLRFSREREATGREGKPADGAFELLLADGVLHRERGSLVFVDRAVDARSGSILIEIAFPNPGGIVRPGQYARVRVATEVRPGALLVPQRAVQELQGLYSLAVVGADGTVERRMVTTGERVGGLWVIASGLRAGERVVVEGVQKARPGGTVAAELVPIEEPPAQEFGRAPPSAPEAAGAEDGE